MFCQECPDDFRYLIAKRRIIQKRCKKCVDLFRFTDSQPLGTQNPLVGCFLLKKTADFHLPINVFGFLIIDADVKHGERFTALAFPRIVRTITEKGDAVLFFCAVKCFQFIDRILRKFPQQFPIGCSRVTDAVFFVNSHRFDCPVMKNIFISVRILYYISLVIIKEPYAVINAHEIFFRDMPNLMIKYIGVSRRFDLIVFYILTLQMRII